MANALVATICWLSVMSWLTNLRYQPVVVDSKHTKKYDKCGDISQPRRSRLAERAFGSLLRSDDDIWVERFYLNTRKQRVYFYRSYNTGKCVLSEPPSGARHIIQIRDLERAPANIQRFAQERLDRGMYSSKMERSKPTLYPTYPRKSGIARLFK